MCKTILHSCYGARWISLVYVIIFYHINGMYALERGEAGGDLLGGILCILYLSIYSPWEEAFLAVLLVMTVGPEISPNLLNLSLSLAVSLGVIP